MDDQKLIGLVTFIYMASSVLYLVRLVFLNNLVGRVASAVAWIGLAGHTAAIIVRWVASYRLGFGHAPLSNLYESMVFFAWAIVVIYLIMEWRTGSPLAGAFAIPIAFLSLAATSLLNPDIQPLMPALQSNWLVSHVVTCFLGYAAFAVAFGTSILYLLRLRHEERGGGEGTIIASFPSSRRLEELSYKVIAVGFPLLTVGIVTGAAWANYAWGSYWSWDPKETWSLIVWLIYATYLHARVVRGWRGRKTALLSIIGFLATIFCYLGVNLLLPGLHSYATG